MDKKPVSSKACIPSRTTNDGAPDEWFEVVQVLFVDERHEFRGRIAEGLCARIADWNGSVPAPSSLGSPRLAWWEVEHLLVVQQPHQWARAKHGMCVRTSTSREEPTICIPVQ